jgi:hypothetical protein
MRPSGPGEEAAVRQLQPLFDDEQPPAKPCRLPHSLLSLTIGEIS